MKKEVPTPNVLLDKTKKRKDGKCPIYISITFNHERAKEATGIYMTEADFKKGKWKTLSVVLKRLSEIQDTIDHSKPPYNPKKLLNKGYSHTIYNIVYEKGRRQHLSKLTIKNLISSCRLFEKYNIPFPNTSEDDLKWLVRKMKEDGYKIGGIATSMKNIKAVFTYADKEGYISKNPFKNYSFKKEGYKFVDNPRALTPTEVTMIIHKWDKEKTTGCGIWLFSYYFGGVSLVDIMKEDWNDINIEVFKGSRYYTKVLFRSKSNEKAHLVVQCNKYTTELLEWVRNKPWGNSTKGSFAMKCNKQLKQIDPSFTLYTARHTFCTRLVNMNIPLSQIAALMGRSPNTLATYIRKLTEESDLSRAADAIYSIEQFGF